MGLYIFEAVFPGLMLSLGRVAVSCSAVDYFRARSKIATCYCSVRTLC
jgi:hypothetical protein